MSKPTSTSRGKARKTQALRRETSRENLLLAATKLFGEQGYYETSLEQTAQKAQLTTRPIYHYFNNKIGLFSAVNDAMSERVLASIEPDQRDLSHLFDNWKSFLALCDDDEFRQILLIDGPNVLGRERWINSTVSAHVRQLFTSQPNNQSPFRQQLLSRMVITAFAEAALMIGESDDIEDAKKETERLIRQLLNALEGIFVVEEKPDSPYGH
ncbi:MAG: TetR family transcriptional regulator [Cellvibrionaceae bacterium]|nr:TetR family transcriptional regulator [Cellvibrionaceae bacterium]|tara:strand:- start:22348 stop:22983 length:636 start_codon:yes stop_codon:yes gene_type:complete